MSAKGHPKTLDPSEARAVLEADLSNIIQKVKDKKTLSAREREIVEQAAEVKEDPKTIVDLVTAIGIPRSVFYRIRKSAGAPTGNNVEEWRKFYDQHQAFGNDTRLTPAEIVNLKGRLLEERTKRETAERKLKEVKLLRETEGWVSMEAATEAITRILEPVNRLLEGLPKAYATRVNPADPDFAEEMLGEMVDDLKEQVQETRGKKISKRKGVK